MEDDGAVEEYFVWSTSSRLLSAAHVGGVPAGAGLLSGCVAEYLRPLDRFLASINCYPKKYIPDFLSLE